MPNVSWYPKSHSIVLNVSAYVPNVTAGDWSTSNLAFSNFLLDTYHNCPDSQGCFVESRYGGYNFKNWVDNSTAGNNSVTIFINTTSLYAYPVYLNLYNNMLLRQISGVQTSMINSQLDPFPFTEDQQALRTSTTALLIAIGFAFIPASWVSTVVRERETKVKHQMLISGVSTSAYWLATYAWDVVNFVVPACMALIIPAIYDISSLLNGNNGAYFLAILMYGLSVPIFTYALSILWDKHIAAQNVMLLVYIFSGAILLIVSIVLDIVPSTQSTNKVLKFFYRLLPNFCFGEAVAGMIVRETSVVGVKGLWDMDITGWPLLFLFFDMIIYGTILVITEYVLVVPELLNFFVRKPTVVDKPFEDDPDVVAEKNRMTSGEGNNDIIRINGLRKVYAAQQGQPPKVAVRDLWFGVAEGECFGFLGINGAGKTTTLQMLTADVLPTSGNAFLAGHSILTEQRLVRRKMGYCPQFDALVDLMTGREHLELFSRIKGMVEADIPFFVEQMVQQLGLGEYADKPCGGYSGGNKRKLCVGIALIGNPSIVFLDEPSTGMDPKSRRFMWRIIASTMKGRSVVLTTHSMDESEALCSRIGIMVGGRLRCIGSAQHLKYRYGNGYQIDVNTGVHRTNAITDALHQQFAGVRIIEKHPHSIKFQIPHGANHRVLLSDLFQWVEDHREALNVVEYSISETTLEQIFIQFAKQQEEETGNVAGITDAEEASPHAGGTGPVVIPMEVVPPSPPTAGNEQ